MKLLSDFTHQYSLSKTARFELKPVSKTLEHLKSNGVLSQDERLSQAYKELEVLLDEYHRDFIERALADVALTRLDDYVSTYQQLKINSKDKILRKELATIQANLRKTIVKCFKKDKQTKQRFDNLFKKDLFVKTNNARGDLAEWVVKNFGDKDARLVVIDQFKGFVTYFVGFHENRRNMYSDEEKHTAIAYRLIHENLPRFIDNLQILQDIRLHHDVLYQQLQGIDRRVLGSESIERLLDLDCYNQLLVQSGISWYNNVLGGISDENNTKLQGINEKINLYNQQYKMRIPKLKFLHKQILSDKQGVSFLPPRFQDDTELCTAVNDFYRTHIDTLTKAGDLMNSLQSYNFDGIYVAYKQLNELSMRIYGDFSLLAMALGVYYSKIISPEFDIKLAATKSDNARTKLYKIKDEFVKSEHSLVELARAIECYSQHTENKINAQDIARYFSSFNDENGVNLVQSVNNKHSTIKGFLEKEREQGEAILYKHKKSTEVKNLKAFLDSILELVHFLKPLALSNNEPLEKDESFYGEFSPIYDELKVFSTLYNKVRDYVAQKPYSIEKFKLNFGNSTLLNGWDLNKEKDNFGVILRKNGLYYLALLNSSHKKVFEKAPKAQSGDVYQKMMYKLLPGPNKMLPKVFFAKGNLEYYNPSKELLENYELGTHKKGEAFSLKDCHALIDYFKVSISKHPEWQHFGFKFSDTSTYKDLSGFYREVEPQGYKVSFLDIDASYIDDLVNQGKLYLFQIYNKDFSDKSYGSKNLHTMYFTEIFSDENLQKSICKLNGEAEIFYRRASLRAEDVAVHSAGELLTPKNPHSRNQKGRTVGHDIIKHKRYTEDKFLFHVPITLNFGVQDASNKDFNLKVNTTIQNSQKTCVIGIDRGERHLLYVSVIDGSGRMLEPAISLNFIDEYNAAGEKISGVNYHALLDEKEKNRNEARINWGDIENIKELKSGYLSQIVHRIATLIRKYTELGYVPLVALEDLNFGFKRGRFKVEKQVYQNFENALIKKLNYLVLKDKSQNEIGGVRHALQLTSKFESLTGIGKQTGFIFYVPAWNTSKIDPATGFVDLLKPRYENIAQAQEFFAKFDSIRYNAQQDYFEFDFDYEKFTDKANGSQTKWTLCSHGDKRYVYNRTANNNKGDTVSIHITEQLKAIFETHGIEYAHGKNLKNAICQCDEKLLYSGLMYLLRVLLAMRYSNANTGEDFILSPVANRKGEFFDSRLAQQTQPQDADANGAYHIALKGLWVVERIKKTSDLQNLDLKLDNKQWLCYAQSKANREA